MVLDTLWPPRARADGPGVRGSAFILGERVQASGKAPSSLNESTPFPPPQEKWLFDALYGATGQNWKGVDGFTQFLTSIYASQLIWCRPSSMDFRNSPCFENTPFWYEDFQNTEERWGKKARKRLTESCRPGHLNIGELVNRMSTIRLWHTKALRTRHDPDTWAIIKCPIQLEKRGSCTQKHTKKHHIIHDFYCKKEDKKRSNSEG
jgi:hypothetical protein